MSFVYLLESVFIGPLKLVFEVIYSLAMRFLGNQGLSIVALSLAMNFLVLPLYRRADAMQEQARDTENKLSRVATHIKKTFSGDERMMILQTYYRQNHYKPTDALRGSVSLLLEIPFFMAAYQFLSGMYILDGVSFGPISNLAKPDGLLSVAGVTINVLPVLMTAINVISSAIYLKGFPLKTKIQLYGMAAFFLVFLYNSPSCLVFYWTLNNLFSLAKTIFYKLKNPKKVLKIAFAICTLGISLLASKVIATFMAKKGEAEAPKPDKKVFLLSCAVLAVLTGFMIPSSVISTSSQEFVDVFHFHHPINYIISSGAYSVGTFLVWVPVFYWLASDKGKVVLSRLMAAAAVVGMINYTFFGGHLGIISPTLQYEHGVIYTSLQKLLSLAVLAVVAAGVWLLATKKKSAMASLLAIALVGTAGLSVWNSGKIIKETKQVMAAAEEGTQSSLPSFRLSQTGENVVVIMLDRAVGYFMPYILEERPDLAQRLDGFTYYENTLSFGGYTNVCTPSLFGGYEYSPVELNKRDDELLADKHNEALKVLPVLFSQNGYEVTVCDPPYAGYTNVPDLSIFDEYPEIDTYITNGRFVTEEQSQLAVSNNYRNFFCYGVMRAMPAFVQRILYGDGLYRQAYSTTGYTLNQTAQGLTQARGVNEQFIKGYSVLENLPTMTQITSEKVNTYLSMDNETTHSPMLLQLPDYVPVQELDNTGKDVFVKTAGENTLVFENTRQLSQYHVTMAALLRLADWFDYLRQQGVYNNTKIILASDHGYYLYQLQEMIMDMGDGEQVDFTYFHPLLLVKDFHATGFSVSQEFMTNADVPTIATQDAIADPINPFTGKPIDNTEKYAHDQFVLITKVFQVQQNNGKTFLADRWASVHTDIFNRDNWTILNEKVVLKDYKMPE